MRSQRQTNRSNPQRQRQTELPEPESIPEMYQRLLRRAVETSPFRPNAEERARKKDRLNLIDQNA